MLTGNSPFQERPCMTTLTLHLDKIICGDVMEVLKTLPSKSVQMVVCSPPYYKIRDYQVAGQIGLEETPALFIERLGAVFREVRRVLKDDGTLWINMGDSYGDKNLLLIPFRLAIALADDGWYF